MDIVSLPVEIDQKAIDSRFRLVIVAAQRARQLMEGEKSMVANPSGQKETTAAIEEILSGKLDILYGDEAVSALREEKRVREEEKRRAILAERESEDTVQARKDLNILLGGTSKTDELPDLSYSKVSVDSESSDDDEEEGDVEDDDD